MTQSDALSLINLVRERLGRAKDATSSLSRYEILLASAALDISLRELSAGDEARAGMTEALARLSPDAHQSPQAVLVNISQKIRKGQLDGDPAIFEALFEVAKINLGLSNPKFLEIETD